MKKKYVVSLNKKERTALERLVKRGENKASLITHANILLKADVVNVGLIFPKCVGISFPTPLKPIVNCVSNIWKPLT
jgi:hypothetical protein